MANVDGHWLKRHGGGEGVGVRDMVSGDLNVLCGKLYILSFCCKVILRVIYSNSVIAVRQNRKFI
jgi:hypothetical protein